MWYQHIWAKIAWETQAYKHSLGLILKASKNMCLKAWANTHTFQNSPFPIGEGKNMLNAHAFLNLIGCELLDNSADGGSNAYHPFIRNQNCSTFYRFKIHSNYKFVLYITYWNTNISWKLSCSFHIDLVKGIFHSSKTTHFEFKT